MWVNVGAVVRSRLEAEEGVSKKWDARTPASTIAFQAMEGFMRRSVQADNLAAGLQPWPDEGWNAHIGTSWELHPPHEASVLSLHATDSGAEGAASAGTTVSRW